VKYKPPVPDVQIAFCEQLLNLKNTHLQQALLKTLADADIAQVDKELGRLVPPKDMQLLARYGLRGELVYPIPYLLNKNPYILAYYRMLLGFSQKSFYDNRRGMGFGKFSSMEKKGLVSAVQKNELENLCKSLIQSASLLINTLDESAISKQLFNELSLLTLGPQLRGSRNNDLGNAATRIVFEIIRGIVSEHIISMTNTEIIFRTLRSA